MPVKWSPENNELLLVKILETSSASFDCDAIVAAWPTDRGEVPTARAIRERLVRIRTNVKANASAGHFTVGVQRSAKNTPTKPRGAAKPTPRKKKGAGANRPIKAEDGSENETPVKVEEGLVSDSEAPTPTPSPGAKRKHAKLDVGGGDGANAEDGGDGGVQVATTERKRRPYSMLWLPKEDRDNLRKDPENESIFAHDEYEEDQKKAAKARGGVDGAAEDDDCVIVEAGGA